MPLHYKTLDITGLRSGKLVPINRTDKKDKHNNYLWNCRCDCGNFILVRATCIKRGGAISCGCVKNSKVRDQSQHWLGYEEISLSYYNALKNGAIRRKIQFDVSIEYLWDLFIKQNRRCRYTNKELNFKSRAYTSDGTASVDRLDSSKGYIEGNVQWVHKQINWMKRDLSDKEFFEWCEIITEHKNKILESK